MSQGLGGGGSAGRSKLLSGVEEGMCWPYEVSGLNDCKLSDGRKERLSKELCSKIDGRKLSEN